LGFNYAGFDAKVRMGEAGNLAPIAVVMLLEAFASVRWRSI